MHISYSESTTEKEAPRPKPRQRTFGLNLQATEKQHEETESQDLSRHQTSSASILLSTDTSDSIAVKNFSSMVKFLLLHAINILRIKVKEKIV